MLVSFLIMLREGIEAALIVGIIAGYLKKTGREAWMPAIWVGILLAVALSLLVGAMLEFASAEFPQKLQEAFEAAVGLVAVFVLTSMVFWMRKMGRAIKSELQASIDAAFSERNQTLALIAMVFFAVAREGLESVFFLLAAFQQSEGLGAPIGALLGLTGAVALGYGIYAGGVHLDLRRFFRWTGVFILVVAAGILAGAMRSLHEAGLWNHLQQTAFDLSAVLPADGLPGSIVAGLLGYQDTPSVTAVIAYVVFLTTTLALFLAPQPQPAASRSKIQREGAK
ncbi:iron uptake transporter permease EfeU [Xanthobacter sp. DSM 24535]|uniref:iron uptake transporter permease EfeU n=1 Tax=Roseixanthobacter psychrophilus TaxID=3119917 RepID=UPI0037280D63